MKKLQLLLVIILLAADTSTAQVYPPSCKDSIFVEELCENCAEFYCFGGRWFLETYLDVRFYPLLKKSKVNTSDIILQIKIDTLGLAKSVTFTAIDTACRSCNEILYKAIVDIQRWSPSFSYESNQWRYSHPFSFEEKDLLLKVRIIDNNIFINGSREKRLSFKPK